MKKILLSVVAIVLLATNVMMNVRAEASSQPINGLSVSILNLQDDQNQKHEVYTATVINKTVNLDFTFEGTLNDPLYLELKIDKKYVDKETMHFSDFNLMQTSEAVVTEGNFFVKRYGLNISNFQGSGNKVDFNFNFATLPYIAPNRGKINYEINLVTKSGTGFTNLFAGTHDSNTLLTREIGLSYLGVGQYENNSTYVYPGKEAKNIDGGMEDENRQGYLTTDKSKLDSFLLESYIFFNATEGVSSDSKVGARGFSEILIEYHLPANVEPSRGLQDSWNYDEATRILSLRVENQFKESHIYYAPVVFPGAKINESIQIPATITATPYDMAEQESVVVYSGTLHVTPQVRNVVIAQPTGLYSNKSGQLMYELKNSRTNTFYYSLFLSTNSDMAANLPLRNITIDDYAMDSRLQYKSLIVRDIDKVTNHQLKIKAKLDDGSSIDVAETKNEINTIRYTIPETLRPKIVSLHFDFGDEGVLMSNSDIYISVGVEMRNQIDPILPAGITTTSMPNTATFKGNYGPGLDFESTSTANLSFKIKEDRRYFIEKRQSNNSQSVYYIQDKPTFDIIVGAKYFEGYGETVTFEKVVDILPEGMNYVTGSTRLIHTYDQYRESANEPTIIYNYKNSGRTALIWELPDYVSNISDPSSNMFETSDANIYRIRYQTEFLSFAKRGRLKNQVYLHGFIGENPDEYWVGTEIVQDEFDINDNGSTDDFVLMAAASVNYSPPFELVSVKEVRGEIGKSQSVAVNKIETEIGADLTYSLRIINNGTTDSQSLGLIDLLPNKGDTTAAIDLQNQGNHTPRNSTLKPVLKTKIKEQEGFEIFYTNSRHSDFPTISQFYGAAEIWSQNPTFNLEETTAIKIVMVNRVLKPNEDINFEVVVRVPDDASLHESDSAVNSFGFTQNLGNTFIESNMASANIARYELSGHIFKDHDKDGKFNAAIDQGLANHKVALFDNTNNPIYDKLGNPIETTTNAEGKYVFQVTAKGRYKVKVPNPQNHVPTIKVLSNDGSHVENDNHTHDVTLNMETKSKVLNAGFIVDSLSRRNVTISKIWVGGPSVKPDIEIQLFANGVAHGEPVVLSNGTNSHTFTNLPVVDAQGNAISYTVDELTTLEHYVKKVDGLTITNTFKPQEKDILVTKVWVGGPSVKPDIEIQLFANGVAHGEPVVLSNGTNGHTFTNLPVFDAQGNAISYTVDELTTLANYEKKVDGFTITNTWMNDIKVPENPGIPAKPQTIVKPSQPDVPLIPTTPSLPQTGVENRDFIAITIILAGLSIIVINSLKKKYNRRS